MAQHDYVIDNSTGANVRADINSVLQAIASNNSGSSAPSTTYALQTFANTTDSMLQLRNAANNAFVNLRKFDGTLPLPDGSASSPSLFFDDDTDTGIFSDAANHFQIATAGVERVEFQTTEVVFNDGGNDIDFRIEGDTDANLFKLDAGNNRIGIGTASPSHALHVVSNGTDTAFFKGRIIRFDGAAASDSPRLNLSLDATDKASILLNRTNSSLNIETLTTAPIIFDTNSTERMRIDSSGRVMIGTTTEGAATADHFTIATSSNTGMTIRSGTSSEGNIFFSDATSGDGESVGMLRYEHSNNAMVIKTANAERMRIDSSGRFMINNTFGSSAHPAADDLIVGATSGSNGMTILTGNTNTGSIFFNDGDANSGTVQYIHSTNPETLLLNSAGDVETNSQMSSQTTAAVRMMKPNAASNVQSHMIHFIVGGHERGAIVSASAFGGTPAFSSISDYRVKTNIRNYTDGWNNIKALPVKLFDINKEGEEATDIKGWVAHEVQAVIPEAVIGTKDAKKEDGSDDYQTLGYGMFMPDVVSALQTAIGKIEVLETKVATLEAA